MNANTAKSSITDELKNSYKEYAEAVALDRAIPDIKDGLKPVQRRIIYSMIKSDNLSNKPYVKSARIVGDTMGKYHPHGDSSIYGALTNMAQDFNMNIPLIDGQGNFGTIDGDGAAAMRYTEARLSKYAESYASMINEGIGKYVDNFDGSLQEIAIIPTLVPNLLINGTSGIAVGIATNIPQFSMSEIIDASIKLIKNPNTRNQALYRLVQGPDFPCGGTVDVSNMESILDTGQGSFNIYAKLEERKGNLYVTEIPQTYSGNKEGLVQDIAKKVEAGKIPEITSIEDQSTDDILIELRLRRGSDIEQVKSKLYSYTGLKSSFSVNMLAIDDNKIFNFNLRDYLEIYVDTCRINLAEEVNKNVSNVKKKLKKLNTLLFVSENINLIIDIITNAKNINAARSCLKNGNTKDIAFSLKKYKTEACKLRLDDEQADTILQTRLSQLINTDVVKVRKEKEDSEKLLVFYTELLDDSGKLDKYLIERLNEIKKEFGRPRRTILKNNVKLDEIEEVEIPVEEIYALIDVLGYIKFINKASFSSANNLDGYKIIKMSNNDRLGFFCSDGQIRYIDPLDIGISNLSDKGSAIESIFKTANLKYLEILPQKEILGSKFIYISKDGYGKIINGEEYKPTGTALYKKVLGSKLQKEDEYIFIKKISDEKNIEVESSERILRFKIDELNIYGKAAKGMLVLNKKYLPLISARVDDFKMEKIGKRASVGEKKNN